MPPVLVALAAATGFIVAARLVSRAVNAQAEALRRASEDAASQQARKTTLPKDLGRLEWDEAVGAYRPAPPGTA